MRRFAGLMVGALLFTQAIVAVHACAAPWAQQLRGALVAGALDAHAPVSDPAGAYDAHHAHPALHAPGAHHASSAATPACQAHCLSGDQTSDHATPAVPAMPVQAVLTVAAPVEPGLRSRPAAPPPPAAGPPPTVRYQIFRS